MTNGEQVLALRARLMVAVLLVGIAIGAVAAPLFVPSAVLAQQTPLEQRLARVEKQLSELQTGQGTVKAPFEILGKSGRAIMSVSEAVGGGVNLQVIAPAGGGSATLGIGDSGAGFLLLGDQGKGDLIAMGRPGGGPAAIQLFNGKGTKQVEISGDNGGGGHVHVLGSGGKPLLAMNGTSGKGTFSVYTASGVQVAVLEESKDGGGRMAVGDAAGGRAAVVGWSPAEGGEVCAATAKQGSRCLGIGLPLR